MANVQELEMMDTDWLIACPKYPFIAMPPT
jgi:hypothetical protein